VKNAIHASSAVKVLSAGWKCFNLAVDLSLKILSKILYCRMVLQTSCVNALQSEMHSLRMDNDRLNQLVKRGHILPPENNKQTAVQAAESKTPLDHVSSEKKLPSDFEDLSFPAKSLGTDT